MIWFELFAVLAALVVVVVGGFMVVVEKVEEIKRMVEVSTAAIDAQKAVSIKSFDHLTTAVTGLEAGLTSAIALLHGLAAEVRALKDSPGAAEALAQRIEHATETLAAAVVAAPEEAGDEPSAPPVDVPPVPVDTAPHSGDPSGAPPAGSGSGDAPPTT